MQSDHSDKKTQILQEPVLSSGELDLQTKNKVQYILNLLNDEKFGHGERLRRYMKEEHNDETIKFLIDYQEMLRLIANIDEKSGDKIFEEINKMWVQLNGKYFQRNSLLEVNIPYELARKCVDPYSSPEGKKIDKTNIGQFKEDLTAIASNLSVMIFEDTLPRYQKAFSQIKSSEKESPKDTSEVAEKKPVSTTPVASQPKQEKAKFNASDTLKSLKSTTGKMLSEFRFQIGKGISALQSKMPAKKNASEVNNGTSEKLSRQEKEKGIDLPINKEDIFEPRPTRNGKRK